MLDVGPIGIEPTHSTKLHLAFNLLVFVNKLQSELSMAEMLVRTVRCTTRLNTVPVVNLSLDEDLIDQAAMLIGGGGHRYGPWHPEQAEEPEDANPEPGEPLPKAAAYI